MVKVPATNTDLKCAQCQLYLPWWEFHYPMGDGHDICEPCHKKWWNVVTSNRTSDQCTEPTS